MKVLTAELQQTAPIGAALTNGGANFSVFSKHATRIELLLFNDAGDTALHRASGESIIPFLVTRGADLDVLNKQRKTPLEVALERKDRNGAIRYPGAVAALRELTTAPTAARVPPKR